MVGVGIDTVDIGRFEEALERTPSLVYKLFSEAERSYAQAHANPAPVFAVRFAAKEATMKALGVGLGSFGFQDVEVQRAQSGAPSLELFGAAASLAQDRGVRSWHVSLSHSCSSATAVVIAE